MTRLEFAQSDPFSLGVELEFQVVDLATLDLVPRAAGIYELIPEADRTGFACEFLQSVFEVQSGICRNVAEVELDLRIRVRRAEQAAGAEDSLLLATGIHPFALASRQKVTENERYLRIMDELQYVGRQFITQGLHVHVGMADKHTAIRVTDKIQAYLPLLLALSASSPFFAGEDTGFSSYRTKLFEILPMAGIADHLGSWDAYREMIVMLRRAGVIEEVRDLWWDVRPCPGFGTVEIRTCDMVSRYCDILALTALIQALACYMADLDPEESRLNPQLLRFNKWQACRHGLEGGFCDPLHILSSDQQSLSWSARRLLKLLEPVMEQLGSFGHLGHLHRMIDEGTSTDRQRCFLREHGSMKRMIEQVHGEFWT